MSEKRNDILRKLGNNAPPDFYKVIETHARTVETFEKTVVYKDGAPLQSAAEFFDATEEKQRKILGIKE
ncbi:hypothetical protein DL93DRAFT_2086585 [Clavulina sp. PMI_390]|nr:hypothetical protein DL93DRAFT_2086585 [Clavulina sp. PMI_390]